MAFTPNDKPAVTPQQTDANVWQEHAHQYQVGSRDSVTPPAVRENSEKHLHSMQLDDQQGRTNVEKQYGVQVTEKDGKYEYHTQENGKDKVLFSTDASAKGIEEGSKKLDGLVDAKEKEIEAKYPGVKFVHPPAELGKQKQPGDTTDGTGPAVNARNPSLKELAGVEAALKNSPRPDGEPLQIQFPDKRMVQGEPDSANYTPPQDGKPAIMNVDMRGDEHAATEKDVSAAARDQNRDRYSIEAVVTHELAHGTESNTDPAAKDAAYQKAGWVPLRHSDDPSKPLNRFDYALKGKDGFLYQPVHSQGANGQDEIKWARIKDNAGYDKDGNYNVEYVDSSGKPITAPITSQDDVLKNAYTIDNNQMFDNARVKPSTRYIDNPEEMMADAVADYRMNPRDLQARCPEIYKAAQALDQQDLDRVYGKGKKVRKDDGTIGDA